jgi:hypothetical protein
MTKRLMRIMPAAIFAGTVVLAAGPALADTTDFADLQAGLGYSSNPRLLLNARSSVFGRLSAYGQHAWRSETGETSLSGYVEDTTYFNAYGTKLIFDLGAHTRRAVSSNVTVFGQLGFSGDYAGQLANRIYYVPGGPPVTDPGNPLPPTGDNQDLLGLVGHQYRLQGEVGASIRTDPKGTLSLSAGAEHFWFSGARSGSDYSIYFGTLGYDRIVSERTSVGGQLTLQRQDFAGSRYANIANPALRLHTQLGETIFGDFSIGILAIDNHANGHSSNSVSPSFSGRLCSTTTESRLCFHAARDAQSQLSAGLLDSSGQPSVSTSVGLNYYRRLGRLDTIQASLSGQRHSTIDRLQGQTFTATYLNGVVGYDRKVGQRFSIGANAGARKLYQPGPDPRIDLTASGYLRYRIGDIL